MPKKPENREKQRKKNAGSFQPGRSGNPGGRPKLPPEVHAVRDFARQHTEEAVDGILKIARSKKAPAAARLAAYRDILDRGHGRAPQSMEISGPNGTPLVPRLPLRALSDGTLAQLEEVLAKADAEVRTAPDDGTSGPAAETGSGGSPETG